MHGRLAWTREAKMLRCYDVSFLCSEVKQHRLLGSYYRIQHNFFFFIIFKALDSTFSKRHLKFDSHHNKQAILGTQYYHPSPQTFLDFVACTTATN